MIVCLIQLVLWTSYHFSSLATHCSNLPPPACTDSSILPASQLTTGFAPRGHTDCSQNREERQLSSSLTVLLLPPSPPLQHYRLRRRLRLRQCSEAPSCYQNWPQPSGRERISGQHSGFQYCRQFDRCGHYPPVSCRLVTTLALQDLATLSRGRPSFGSSS